MPTPNPQDSLRALLSGGQNIANSRVAMRNTQLQDPRSSEAFRRLVMGENDQEAADQQDDPMNQRYAAISAGQNAATVDRVPEIARLHDQELADKERLATAPARTAGMFNVQAAQAAGHERALLADENRKAIEGRQAQTQQNIGQRQQMTQQALNQRQRVAGLQKGTIKAARPANEGLLSRWLTGPSQTELNQHEIAGLQGGQGGQGGHSGQGGGAADFSNPQVGDRAEAEDGTPLEFDGTGWAVIE